MDSLNVHEVLLPGHLYLMILKEKLEDTLSFLKSKIIKDAYGKEYMKVMEK